MAKELLHNQILIVSNNVIEIEHICQLLQDRILFPNITVAELQTAENKLSAFKFDVLILITEDLNDAMELLISNQKNTIEIPLILISNTLTLTDIQNKKIINKKNIVFDYLPLSELNSLLLFKSIQYVEERNKHHIKHKTLKRRYRDLFQMNPLPMWIYDLEFLKFLQVNDAAIRKYGYSREEFMNMTLKDIRPTEDIVKLEKAIDMVRKHEKLFSNGIYRHKKKDNSLIYVEIVSNIIYIDKLKYELVLANDITDSLNYIQAIENQNSKLQEIAFAHSHIIRAPLTNIMGILNLVREMDLNSPESAELLAHLSTSCNQLDEKITEVVKKSASYPLPKKKK